MDKHVRCESYSCGKVDVPLDSLRESLTPEQLEYLSKPNPTIKAGMWVWYKPSVGDGVVIFKTDRQEFSGCWVAQSSYSSGFDPATHPDQEPRIYPCPPEVAEWAEKGMGG